MHELTLFAHVPNARVPHVKRALTAFTGMHPVPLLEHHLLYKPKRNRQTVGGGASGNGGPGPAGAAAAADFYFLKLVAEILAVDEKKKEETDVPKKVEKAANDDAMDVDSGDQPNPETVAAETEDVQAYNVRKQKWSIRFADLPEVPGKRPVTSRMIYHAAVNEGDALSFVDSLGYSLISEYVVSGSYFVHHNAHITLTRIILPPQPLMPFPLGSCQPIDPADSYILQASIKVHNANEQDTMARGVEELKTLKSELKGVVDLEVGDRLSLDTRVR
ncbi:hypothetical protein ABW19_dt0209596 [Dactylella cylindrospora]|nr:hypothetical protein ABW19_dt0209596 [Dactylella cylindrospora]